MLFILEVLMYESFISDNNLFNNKFSSLIDTRNKPGILYDIKQKHIDEIENSLPVDLKKSDLIIWNAVFSREIIRHGVSKKYLHPIYNKYYEKINDSSDIETLQRIELDMANTYMDLLISDIEVKDNFVVNKILQHIHINLENHLTLEDIAKHIDITPQYAASCFKKHMGISLMKYMKKVKIDRAKVLLTTTNKSILEIALTLGFYDQSHFSKTFKSFEGVSPSKFRNTNYN